MIFLNYNFADRQRRLMIVGYEIGCLHCLDCLPFSLPFLFIETSTIFAKRTHLMVSTSNFVANDCGLSPILPSLDAFSHFSRDSVSYRASYFSMKEILSAKRMHLLPRFPPFVSLPCLPALSPFMIMIGAFAALAALSPPSLVSLHDHCLRRPCCPVFSFSFSL